MPDEQNQAAQPPAVLDSDWGSGVQMTETDDAILGNTDPGPETPTNTPDRDEKGQFKGKDDDPDPDPADPVPAAESEGDAQEDDAEDSDGEDDAVDESGDGEDEKAEKLPHGAVKRLQRARSQRNEAERRAEEAVRKAEELEARIKAFEEAEKIDENDFDTYADYEEARAKALAPAEKPEPKDVDGVPEAELSASLADLRAACDDVDPEIWEAATDEAADLKINATMVVAMSDEPNPAAVVQHLTEHPDEAARIAAMKPTAARKAIDRLGAKLEMGMTEKAVAKAEKKPAKRPSKAPEPIAPVSGQAPQTVTLDTVKTQSDYERLRSEDEKRAVGDW